ncbi:MAG: exodeoxyribonuclease VII small subunit [Alphaproteobacteria bacterium]
MAGGEDIQDGIAKMGFEDALKELEQIVRSLESGDAKLDEAISSYERGAALKKHCEAKLAEAKSRIERISFSNEGARTEQANIE